MLTAKLHDFVCLFIQFRIWHVQFIYDLFLPPICPLQFQLLFFIEHIDDEELEEDKEGDDDEAEESEDEEDGDRSDEG